MHKESRKTIIKSVEVRNFKSFDKLKIEFGSYNVFIGANASGKSNFLEIFRFLNDTAKHGLENAISLQGGKEFFLNGNLKSNKFTIKVSAETQQVMFSLIDVTNFTYELCIRFNDNNYIIESEQLELDVDILESTKSFLLQNKFKKGKSFSKVNHSGKLFFTRKNNRFLVSRKGIDKKVFEKMHPFIHENRVSNAKKTLVESRLAFLFIDWTSIFSSISIYDIDPKLPKRAISFSGKQELEPDGSNLTIVLKQIEENPDKRKKFYALLNDLLPHIKNLKVKSVAHKSLLFNVTEEYSTQIDMPASLISEGTINIISLIFILYFQGNPLILIEEPEKNIHPKLISKIAALLSDASKNKQIIITTHNPDLIKFTTPENVFLVSRTENGHSKITKPINENRIKEFLKSDIGVDELFKMDLLS